MSNIIKHQQVGNIGNQYGDLNVAEHEGKYYWVIVNYDTDLQNIDDYEEIPKLLYDALLLHNENC